MKRSAERTAGSRRRRPALLARGLVAAGAVAALAGGASAAQAAERWGLEPASPLQSQGRNVVEAWGWATGDRAVYLDSLIPQTVEVPRRTPSGAWQQQSIMQQSRNVLPQLEDATADMSRRIVYDNVQSTVIGWEYDLGIYVHDGDAVTTVAQFRKSEFTTEPPVVYLGGSDDKRTLIFTADDGRLDAPASNLRLYRWVDGRVTPIELDLGRPPQCPSQIRGRLGGAAAPIGGGPRPRSFDRGPLQTGISADGRTIVVASNACSYTDGGGRQVIEPQLHLIRDDVATEISRPLPGERDAAATFVGMTRDGERVFFTSAGRLLADDADGVNALYLWERGELRRITGDPAVPTDAVVVSNPIASPDGTTVWFQVRSGAGAEQRHGLYAWRDGKVSHVVELDAAATLDPTLSANPAQVSFDGSALLLPSRASLFDDVDPRGFDQLYRIRLDGSVACVSCGPDGVGLADATTGYAKMPAGGWPRPRISGDGSTVAFETTAALVARDTNGVADVYVWRDGDVTLLSSGTVASPAIAAGMSWDGRTVFFQSWGALVPGTTDAFNKLYAARLGGGYVPPQPPTPCGADCQGQPTPAPFLPVPGSETFHGAGNLEPAPTLTVRRIGPAAQRRLARRGAVTVIARSSAATTIRAGMRVRIGTRWVRTDRTVQRLAGPGQARLRLALSPRARRTLARTGALRVQVTVASSAVAGQRRASFVLRGPRSKAPGRARAQRSINETTTVAPRPAASGSGRHA